MRQVVHHLSPCFYRILPKASSSGPVMQAFATRISTPPSALTVDAVANSTLSAFETSVVTVCTIPRAKQGRAAGGIEDSKSPGPKAKPRSS